MDLISLIIGIVGGAASILGLYLAIPKTPSWRSVNRAVVDIVHKMHTQGYSPELIILYGRGGAIFGGLLAGNLGNIPVASLDREVIIDEGHTETGLLNKRGIPMIRGLKVLLVTGEVITGNQLGNAMKALLKKSPAEIRTASFYVCESSTTYPDYYYKETAGPIRVPWRILKDYKRTSKLGLLVKDV